MARLTHEQADNGTLAGLGLLSVIASVLLALSLAASDASTPEPASPALLPILQGLLGAIRVGA